MKVWTINDIVIEKGPGKIVIGGGPARLTLTIWSDEYQKLIDILNEAAAIEAKGVGHLVKESEPV